MADAWHDNSVSTALVKKDDDDDVPDDWENEPEEKPTKSTDDESKAVSSKAPATTKNKLKKKFGDEERLNDEKFLESLKEPNREYTADELAELHKRAELHKEESMLNQAAELVNATGENQSLDNMNLVTREEFENYSFRLYNRLELLLAKSEFYPDFLDHLLTGLSKSMSSEGIKRMTATLQSALLRKQTEEKEKKTKAKVKKPAKPKLKAERFSEFDSFGGDGLNAADEAVDYDEDTDFM